MQYKLIQQNLILKCLCVSFLALSFACSELSLEDQIDQGSIEYSITYPNIPEDSYLLDLMPKKMETRFVNGSFRSDIVAGMGLFKTSIICKDGDNGLVHTVKMLNKKYASSLNSKEIKDFNPDFQDIKIEPLKETKEIAGLKCSAVKVVVSSDSTWSFVLYYTNEIQIKDANKHTPFHEITGVLMQYDLVSYDTHMRFIANEVSELDIDDEEFDLGDDYKIISPPELKKEIETIFANVK